MANNFIDLATAKNLINRYRNNIDAMTTPDFKGAFKFSETFDANAILALLNQPGCVEFRAYYGMKEDKSICSIFFGVDAQGNDIINSTKANGTDVIVEEGRPCPPYCNGNTF